MRASGIVACLAFAAAAAVPFQPWAGSRSGASWFEATLASDAPGLATLRYDVGRGFNDADSAVQPVAAGRPSVLRFALPSGRLGALRLTLLDRDARMTLTRARISDGAGRALAVFGPERFQPAGEIASMDVRDGALSVATAPDAANPSVSLALPRGLELPRAAWWTGIASTFAVLLAALAAVEAARRSPAVKLESRWAALRVRAGASPGAAIMAVALLATLLANYPVVFGGKSFVSPNLGTALLYGKNPWVPGFQSTERGNANYADIDALMWQHVPYSVLEHRALFRDGELPLWNRYNSAGTPLLAQVQTGIGDPLHLIPFLADGAPWAWDLKFLLSKWLLACGAGFCVWRLTRSLPASLMLAASAQFIGFFVYRVNHPAVFSVCYAPWILYCWLRVVDTRSARGAVLWLAALAGANLAELASGTVKEADMLLLCLNVTGACMLLLSRRPWRERLVRLGLASLQGAVFAMIGSPVWYTFYRALRHAYTMYEAPEAFQLQPGMLVGLFDELFYRPFQIFSNVINPSANFFILLGLLWAAVRWRSVMRNRAVAALALSSVPALLLAFGAVPPGAITRVPYLGNILHIDNTFSCVLILQFTLIAGAGWKEAWDALGSEEGGREAAAVLAALAALCGIYLGTAQAVVRSAYSIRSWGFMIKLPPFVYGYGLSLLLASALLLWAIRRARRRGAWSAALALLAALGFAALHWRHGLQSGMAFADYVIMPTDRVDLRAPSPALEALAARGGPPVRTVGFVDNFFPGWSGVYGMEGLCGADSLINRYYRDLVGASGIEQVWGWRYKLEDRDLETARPILDVLNVRYYLDYPAGRRAPRRGLRPVASSDMEAYESPTVWPRAFFTDRVAVYGDLEQYLSWIRAGDGRPFAAIDHGDWLRMSPAPRVSGDITGRAIRAAEDYRLTANTTTFTVAATGPGFIVLSEAFESDNFRVSVNGAEVPYVRMNHAFKGVYVDAPGRYVVRFSYWPRGLTTTLLVFGIGLGLEAALVLAALLALKRPVDDGAAGI